MSASVHAMTIVYLLVLPTPVCPDCCFRSRPNFGADIIWYRRLEDIPYYSSMEPAMGHGVGKYVCSKIQTPALSQFILPPYCTHKNEEPIKSST